MKDLQTKSLPMLKALASNYSEFMEMSDKGPSVGVPKVIYASRTHSQLAQAMQEMKKTNYNGMKAAIIGSREQLCIHPDVIKESSNSTKVSRKELVNCYCNPITKITNILVLDSHVQTQDNNENVFVLSQSRIYERSTRVSRGHCLRY